jgi:phosphoribosyl 1,2-cyclic phosphodiesterase
MLRDGPYPLILQKRIRGEYGHMSNVDCARTLRDHMKPGATVFLAHLSKNNNKPDVARQTVADVSGIDRRKIDCMEFQCDIRTLKKR